MTTVKPPHRVEGYEQFFGFDEPPFSLAPNPRFLFEGASHAAALEQVTYALERREPLVVITGDVGTGKTLLCRTVLQRSARKTFVSVIHDPLLGRDDLLKQLLQDFGVISKDRTRLPSLTRHDMAHALGEFLASLAPLQAHAVVIIDEAQHLQPDVLEQIRLLANVDDDRGTLLQIVLVGQTDIEALLSRPALRQFQQRVSRRFRMEPLAAGEIEQYIEHRLAVASGLRTASSVPGARELDRAMSSWSNPNAGVTFALDAIAAVSALSHGSPRLINVLCDRALEAAFARRVHVIDASLIQEAAAAIAPSSLVPSREGTTTDATADSPREPAISSDRFASTGPSTSVAVFDAASKTLDMAGEPSPFTALGGATPTRRRKTALVIAAALVMAGGAAWFGLHSMNAPVDGDPAPGAPTASSPTSARPPEPAAAPSSSPESPTAVPDQSKSAPPASPRASSEVEATADRFEIVVASFRTEARANSVTDAVMALGLPTRRRAVEGWEQVLVGPFASRAEADEARRRLDTAGLTGSQIISSR